MILYPGGEVSICRDKTLIYMRLYQKKVVITGAGSGIGQAIAVLFAQEGAVVYVLDREVAAATHTQTLIQENGSSCEVLSCDVADHKGVHEVFKAIGQLDILVNNAGVAHVGNVEHTAEADFDRLVSVNIKGVYNCLHAAIPLLKERGGVVLNMASIAALSGIPDRFAYSLTKAAVVSMTQTIARDYVQHGIRSNSISPARIHTPFVDGFLAKNYPGHEAEMFARLAAAQPIGRMGKPDEVAQLALFLCSDEAAFITGCDYPIDGGFLKLLG
jgi:2-keto-3-deoxy-L-fuconate dehydrogenase